MNTNNVTAIKQHMQINDKFKKYFSRQSMNNLSYIINKLKMQVQRKEQLHWQDIEFFIFKPEELWDCKPAHSLGRIYSLRSLSHSSSWGNLDWNSPNQSSAFSVSKNPESETPLCTLLNQDKSLLSQDKHLSSIIVREPSSDV